MKTNKLIGFVLHFGPAKSMSKTGVTPPRPTCDATGRALWGASCPRQGRGLPPFWLTAPESNLTSRLNSADARQKGRKVSMSETPRKLTSQSTLENLKK